MPEENAVFLFNCPQCGTEFELPVEYIGQAGKCKVCGNIFEIKRPGEKPVEQNVSAASQPVQEEAVSEPVAEEQKTTEIETGSGKTREIDVPKVSEAAADDSESTNTMALPREQVGMLPQIKDDPYKVTSVERPPTMVTSIHSYNGPVKPGKPRKRVRRKEKSASEETPGQQEGAASGAEKKPWWSSLLFWKK